MNLKRPAQDKQVEGTRSTFTVEGLTCGCCIAEIIEAVRVLPHVTGVAVDLVAGGSSVLVVHTEVPLSTRTVLDSVAVAGFRGSASGKRPGRELQRTEVQRAPAVNFPRRGQRRRTSAPAPALTRPPLPTPRGRTASRAS